MKMNESKSEKEVKKLINNKVPGLQKLIREQKEIKLDTLEWENINVKRS